MARGGCRIGRGGAGGISACAPLILAQAFARRLPADRTVLTAYIPMLTDAGGNAGSQSTSTIIRGMAVGDIEPHDLPKILWREFRIAILCGGTLALCNFAKLIFLDGIAPPVAAVVCLTLICTVILSQLIGGLLPVIAEKLNFDPAVMASPLITTIVDTTTLLVYFNIARVLLRI